MYRHQHSLMQVKLVVRKPRLLLALGLISDVVVRQQNIFRIGRSYSRWFGRAPQEYLALTTFQWQQIRWSSKKRQRQVKNINADPFKVLGVTRAQSFAAVKRAFLQIAMKHHPDTAAAGTKEELEANKEFFMDARMAFESIVAGPDGLAILKSETADYVEEDLDEWFKTETGYDMPFMDAATMKEVAEMTESVGGGLDRDGGMWTLARMVADTVKSGGDGRSLLQLDAGVVRDRDIDGILRRKRRR